MRLKNILMSMTSTCFIVMSLTFCSGNDDPQKLEKESNNNSRNENNNNLNKNENKTKPKPQIAHLKDEPTIDEDPEDTETILESTNKSSKKEPEEAKQSYTKHFEDKNSDYNLSHFLSIRTTKEGNEIFDIFLRPEETFCKNIQSGVLSKPDPKVLQEMEKRLNTVIDPEQDRYIKFAFSFYDKDKKTIMKNRKDAIYRIKKRIPIEDFKNSCSTSLKSFLLCSTPISYVIKQGEKPVYISFSARMLDHNITKYYKIGPTKGLTEENPF